MRTMKYSIPLNTADVMSPKKSMHQVHDIATTGFLVAHLPDKRAIDDFMDLIVFTRPGECQFAQDFGFSFWSDIHNNISIENFNNTEYPRKKYIDELVATINKYEPRLKGVRAEMLLSQQDYSIDYVRVKFTVRLTITGIITGLKEVPYQRSMIFSVGPTLRKTSKLKT